MFKITAYAVAVSLATATVAHAADLTVESKIGGNLTERTADRAVCAEISQHREVLNSIPSATGPVITPYYGPDDLPSIDPAAGIAAAILIAVVADQIERKIARDRSSAQCMRNLGYRDIPLTETEADAYRDLNEAERDAWEEAFIKGDLGDRFTAVETAENVPALPALRDDPWTAGTVRILPDSLTVIEGPLRTRAVVLTGRAQARGTATLDEGFASKVDKYPILRAQAGATFQQVDNRIFAHPLIMREDTTWCGPVQLEARPRRNQTEGRKTDRLYCFSPTKGGYFAYDAGEVTDVPSPFAPAATVSTYNHPIRLTPTVATDPKTYDIEVVLQSAGSTQVTVAIYVKEGSGRTLVTTRTAPVVGEAATIPLWDKALVIRHADSRNYEAALQAGDGRPLFAADNIETAYEEVDPEIVAASSLRNGVMAVIAP